MAARHHARARARRRRVPAERISHDAPRCVTYPAADGNHGCDGRNRECHHRRRLNHRHQRNRRKVQGQPRKRHARKDDGTDRYEREFCRDRRDQKRAGCNRDGGDRPSAGPAHVLPPATPSFAKRQAESRAWHQKTGRSRHRRPRAARAPRRRLPQRQVRSGQARDDRGLAPTGRHTRRSRRGRPKRSIRSAVHRTRVSRSPPRPRSDWAHAPPASRRAGWW